MPTPRLFIIRHGKTEWSLNGRHTSVTDIPLTPAGEAQVRATGKALVGMGRLIGVGRVARIYVSPRTRARRTLELLGLCDVAEIEVCDAVREWEYGAYEGMTSAEIDAQRRAQGLNEPFSIWLHPCPSGDSPTTITHRIDPLITHIRTKYHTPSSFAPNSTQPADVVIVAHGHILRALAARWVGRKLDENPGLLLEAGGVGVLSYEHGRREEPVIVLGGAWMGVEDEEGDGEGGGRGFGTGGHGEGV